MTDRITGELQGIDLGDARLNRRSKQVLEALNAHSQSSINASFEKWSDTLAAYRLFDHEAAQPEAILEPHRKATLTRIEEHPVVLVVQDTTELDFSKHPPADAGCLNKPDRHGFYLHVELAVTPSGVPLGVVGSNTFDRSPESLGRTLERRELPIEQKESYRWLQGYRRATQIAQQLPETQFVSVADCEADMHDIFEETQQDASADFVIRSKEDRSTTERIPPDQHDSRKAVYRKFRDELRDSPVRFQKTIDLVQTPKRAARQATLEIRAQSVSLKHPKNRCKMANVDCQVVYVQEVNGPGDDTDIEWWLLTSLPVEDTEQIERVISYYQARWTVEVYFRVLKTGCNVEEIQLETTARLKSCLAFYQIIAWRVLSLTHLHRESPELPCDVVFADYQWQSVWRVTTQQPLPSKVPSLAEFIPLLASLGGYNNRASEAPPGPQTIWIGIRRSHDYAQAWLAFGPETKTYV